MKAAFILKYDDSVDGRGSSRTLFVSEDRDAIVQWIKERHPDAEWDDLKHRNYASHMYDSYSIEPVCLVDSRDLQDAKNAKERIPELESRLKELQDELDGLRKVSI